MQDFPRHPHILTWFEGVFGPAATKWYSFLQHKIKLQNHNATIAARVAADQVVFASTNMALFLSSMAVMEGSDPKAKLKKSYWEGLKANYMLWPAVQAINFKLVPLEHRVLVVNIVSLGKILLLFGHYILGFSDLIAYGLELLPQLSQQRVNHFYGTLHFDFVAIPSSYESGERSARSSMASHALVGVDCFALHDILSECSVHYPCIHKMQHTFGRDRIHALA